GDQFFVPDNPGDIIVQAEPGVPGLDEILTRSDWPTPAKSVRARAHGVGGEKPLVSLLFRSLPRFSTPNSQQKISPCCAK
ncbi:hypothetical protein N7453_000466, partial [Penicillium expansum]